MTILNFDDPAAQEDLAAERDDDDNDPAGADADADAHEPLHSFAGTVATGPAPYPGRLLVSRFPGGVLLIGKEADRAWLLDFDPATGTYECRDTAGMPIDTAGRCRAAEGADYEVRAYDPDFAGDDPPGTEQCDEAGCDDDAGGAR